MKKFMLSLLLVTPFVCENVPNKKFLTNVSRCENDEVICYTIQSGYGDGISCKFKEKENVYIHSNVSTPERESSRELQKSELLYNEFRGLPRE
ncbi:MAG: hypothetical protein II378_03340 [Clostridia bacterium]|nr:hypothetical protein [Clostridia bacterium]